MERKVLVMSWTQREQYIETELAARTWKTDFDFRKQTVDSLATYPQRIQYRVFPVNIFVTAK